MLSTSGACTHADYLQRNSSPNHFHQHHCECCCDFHPVRSHPATVMACSCSSSCSHHNSTLTPNRHPPVRCWTIDRSMGMKWTLTVRHTILWRDAHTDHHERTTDQFTCFTDSPSSSRLLAYILYCLRTSCTYSDGSFLCTVSTDVQTLLLT